MLPAPQPLSDNPNKIFEALFELSYQVPLDYENGSLLLSNPSREIIRQGILQLQANMEAEAAAGTIALSDLSTVFPLRHFFVPGVYSREMTLPAGHWIIGKIHKHAHMNVISTGRVVVITEEGVRVFQAPYVFRSEPFTKRVVLVIDTTVWTTHHITNETDLSLIEAELILPNFTSLPCADTKELS